jgi:hypothetical protein
MIDLKWIGYDYVKMILFIIYLIWNVKDLNCMYFVDFGVSCLLHYTSLVNFEL